MKQSSSEFRSRRVGKEKGKGGDSSSHIPKPKMSNPGVNPRRPKRGGCSAGGGGGPAPPVPVAGVRG